jgi:hypothetical protein
VCPPQKKKKIEKLVYFCEIQLGGYAVEGYLEALYFSPIASPIPKLQTFRLLTWMQNFHQSMWDHGILYADRSPKDE